MTVTRVFTPTEAALFLRTEESTVTHLIQTAQLRVFHIPNQQVRITLEAIEEYVLAAEEALRAPDPMQQPEAGACTEDAPSITEDLSALTLAQVALRYFADPARLGTGTATDVVRWATECGRPDIKAPSMSAILHKLAAEQKLVKVPTDAGYFSYKLPEA